MILRLLYLFYVLLFDNAPQSRLDRVEEKSRFQKICETIAPYVIVVCIVLLTILFLVILIKYGGFAFGTEANHYYNGDLA